MGKRILLLLVILALSRGADVPMCLHGRTCFAGGIGETLDVAPALPDCALVLANPGLSLATPDVFRARSGAYSALARFVEAPADVGALAELLAARRNDLEAPAKALAPVIGDVLRALGGMPGSRFARMSGSGATCFALFEDAAEAEKAADILRAQHGDWWIVPSRLIQAA
jgi:4-diphosphocytidyl-2-C-methyl-D-erythritol kinase